PAATARADGARGRAAGSNVAPLSGPSPLSLAAGERSSTPAVVPSPDGGDGGLRPVAAAAMAAAPFSGSDVGVAVQAGVVAPAAAEAAPALAPDVGEKAPALTAEAGSSGDAVSGSGVEGSGGEKQEPLVRRQLNVNANAWQPPPPLPR
ncbi:unnamed protein product, partial [Scytosiphon promiscuus]